MLIKLSGARVFDPTQNWNGEVRDIFMRDGRMVAEPEPGARIDETYSLPGRVIMVPCAALALYCSTVSPAAAMRR